MKKVLALGCVVFFSSAQVFAAVDVENNKTITRFGLNDGTENGYFGVAEGINPKCKFGVVMFSGKGFLSVLLATKMAGKKITLLSYNFDAVTTQCNLTSLEVE
jgi:hypothetical protein